MLDLDTRRAIFQLKALGHGVRAIARALRISRNSVRAVLALGSAEVPALEREQRGASHLDVLRVLYAECKGNRVRVWEEAQKQGLAISYPALTAFLRRCGVGVQVKQPAGRYHFAPGQEMQHDTSPHDVKVGDTVRRLQCASLVLCCSRMIFARAYPVWNRFHARLFLSEAIVHFGGAADQCMIDNSSVIIAHGTGKDAVPAPEMAALAARFDFHFRAHELGDANRSARVERPFDYIERNFYPGRRFTDLNDLNAQFAAWCEQVNTSFRKHFGFRPSEMHGAERPLLKRLPLYIPEVYDLHQRMVDIESFVHLHRNRYEVPPALIGRRVEIRESKDRVRIFCGPKEVAVHARHQKRRLVCHQLSIVLEEARLAQIVGLLHELPLGFVGDACHIQLDRQQIEQAQQCRDVVDVAGDRAGHAGVLNLQCEVAPISRGDAMHLPD